MKLIVTVEADGTEDQVEEILDQLEEMADERLSLEVGPSCYVDVLSVVQAPGPGRRPKGEVR